NVLNMLDKKPYKEIISHFDNAQEKINQHVLKIIKNRDVIFTHCHSTNVVNSLINAKKKGRKFQVYNTETRPLYQGRKTAQELRRAGIKDVYSKTFGKKRTTFNLIKACVDALKKTNL
ncbi:unnamed protein product, partial [marine sediment metagenome]